MGSCGREAHGRFKLRINRGCQCPRDKTEREFSTPLDLKAANKQNGNGFVNVT